LYFEYLSNSSSEGQTSIPLIHLESIEMPSRAVCQLRISRIQGNESVMEREVEFNGIRSRGCAFTVSEIGNYSLVLRSSEPELFGCLVHDGIDSFSAGEPSDNLYSSVQFFSPAPSPTRTSPPASQTGTDVFTRYPELRHRNLGVLLKTVVFVFPAPW
jgi:hypothetical protein